jgi:hypothetical protein
MPLLRIRAIEPKKVRVISKAMIDELERLLQCPRDYFVVEVIHSTFILDGEEVEGAPVVEVSWFDRGQELQDKAAEIITKYVRLVGYINCDVIFMPLEKEKYYENGKHF